MSKNNDSESDWNPEDTKKENKKRIHNAARKRNRKKIRKQSNKKQFSLPTALNH